MTGGPNKPVAPPPGGASPVERAFGLVAEGGGHLAANVVSFGRLLRLAGLPIGPGKLIEALRALQVVDITDPAEFYWALHAVLVHRRDEADLFARAFELFWLAPPEDREELVETEVQSEAMAPSPLELSKGVQLAAAPPGASSTSEEGEGELPEGEVAAGFSPHEMLRRKDFEQMDEEQLRAARRVVRRMNLALETLPTRRYRAHPRGESVDLRATLRASIRAGGASIPLERRTRRRRPPPLVALCDISGSMRAYTRMLLHFLHALTEQRDRVHTFLFGTRLTNATPYLRRKNPEEAMRQLGEVVLDWDGGTRIGASLAEFNLTWSRRVLTRGAVVLLITDGLDQEGGENLEAVMRRLHASCRRLVWLNPLLRHEDFEPQAAGIRAMVSHVDDLRAVHNLESLEKLADALRHLDSPVRTHRWRKPLAVPTLVRPAPSLAQLWVPKEERPAQHPRVAPPPKAKKERSTETGTGNG